MSNRLQIPALLVTSKYPQILAVYTKELKFVQDDYNSNKTNPPIARNLPPLASCIAWSRQLYDYISKPVKMFQELPEFMDLPETRRAIRGYNKLAQVLVEYELVNLHLWKQNAEKAKASLVSTILLRDKETGELHVNFNPMISVFYRDVQYLNRMGIEISSTALALYSNKNTVLENYNKVKVSRIRSIYCV